MLDYAGAAGSLTAPKILKDRRAAAMLGVSGAGALTTSLFTDYELGVRRRLPMRVHLLIDAAAGALLVSGAVALRRSGAKVLDCAPLLAIGVAELAGAAMTSSQPGDRSEAPGETAPGDRSDVPGETAPAQTTPATGTPADAGPPLAPPPPETPGPSVTPPETPESDVERMERVDAGTQDPDAVPDDDVLVAQEESAAAAEAARIGGVVPAQSDDPAMEPLYEAGEGEQEGWEAAEADLVENATHGDGHADPARDALSPELESDRSTAAYGEADEENKADE